MDGLTYMNMWGYYQNLVGFQREKKEDIMLGEAMLGEFNEEEMEGEMGGR